MSVGGPTPEGEVQGTNENKEVSPPNIQGQQKITSFFQKAKPMESSEAKSSSEAGLSVASTSSAAIQESSLAQEVKVSEGLKSVPSVAVSSVSSQKPVTVEDVDHGNISRAEAEQLLPEPGSYLVRDSSTFGDCRVYSANIQGNIFHSLFKEEGGQIQPHSQTTGGPEGESYASFDSYKEKKGATKPVFKAPAQITSIDSRSAGRAESNEPSQDSVTVREVDHGRLERAGARNLLMKPEFGPGSYLVRDSSMPGYRVFSNNTGGTIKNMLFKEEGGIIQMYQQNGTKGDRSYSDIGGLVAAAGGTKPVLNVAAQIAKIDHGNIGRAKSERLLLDSGEGSYLVRNSSIAGYRVYSTNINGNLTHSLFKAEEDGKIQMYSMDGSKDGDPFSDLGALVTHFRGNNPVGVSL